VLTLISPRRPLLSINAFDDPICDGRTLPISSISSSSHVYLAITGSGGHLGWFDGKGQKTRWILKPIQEFLVAATRDLGLEGRNVEVVSGDEHGDANGNGNGGGGWEWVVEPAHDMVGRVGWRVMKEGEIVAGEEGEGVLQGL
jgi:hypothetical protein